MPQLEPVLNLLNGLASLVVILLTLFLLWRSRGGRRRGPTLLFPLAVLAIAAFQAVQFLASVGVLPTSLLLAPFLTLFLLLAGLGLYRTITTEPVKAEEIKEKGVIDSLTGLYDRSFLEHYLVHRVRDLEEGKRELSLLYIDIDDFRAYQVAFGQHAAESLLRVVASTLATEARTDDILVRFGEDEFVIAARTGRDNALSMAERIRKAVATKGNPQIEPRLKRQVTISAGLATWMEDGQSAKQLTEVAARRLTEAKRRGKNLVYGGVRAASQKPRIEITPQDEISRE